MISYKKAIVDTAKSFDKKCEKICKILSEIKEEGAF